MGERRACGIWYGECRTTVMITWMTQMPESTLEKPQLLKYTSELSADTVMTRSVVYTEINDGTT